MAFYIEGHFLQREALILEDDSIMTFLDFLEEAAIASSSARAWKNGLGTVNVMVKKGWGTLSHKDMSYSAQDKNWQFEERLPVSVSWFTVP